MYSFFEGAMIDGTTGGGTGGPDKKGATGAWALPVLWPVACACCSRAFLYIRASQSLCAVKQCLQNQQSLLRAWPPSGTWPHANLPHPTQLALPSLQPRRRSSCCRRCTSSTTRTTSTTCRPTCSNPRCGRRALRSRPVSAALVLICASGCSCSAA